MADKKKDEKKAEITQPKDVNAQIYDEYAHGRIINEIAEERGLDSKEVLAIIQAVQQAQAKKGKE